MKILGLDNGFNFTKTTKDVCIASTIIKGIDDINNVLQMKWNKQCYIVGDENGEYIGDADKLSSERTKEVLKVTSLAAIGLSYKAEKTINVNLVVGVPVAYFSKQKEEMRNLMLSIDDDIFLNQIGFKQHIKVEECFVYPQSAGVIMKRGSELKNDTSLVIDIGGGTWDVSEFNGLKLEEMATYSEGMLILYSKIAQFLNSNYYTKFRESDIHRLLLRRKFTANGRDVDIAVVDPIIKNHVNAVLTTIKRDFHTSNVDNIFLIGGGAFVLFDLIKMYLPNAVLLDNAQFLNAECFEFMGKLKLKSTK